MSQPSFTPFGADLFGHPIEQTGRGPLADAFVMPPFSVLNAREGEWQERKAAWIALGMKPEARTVSGRNCTTGKNSCMNRMPEHLQPENGEDGGGVVSIFDPVVCELAYRWFCPPRGAILDPFAGGSVRGVVAGILGHSYWGCDLRPEQIAANDAQRASLCPDAAVSWTCGDALALLHAGAPRWSDLVFTCPPYGDLERYSDDPRDLSTMEYQPFLAAWAEVLRLCEFRLKPNRFACVVVGDFRDSRGNYRGFVADTIISARAAGLALYNDAVLVTSVGSLPLRVGGQFTASRKLGKTHQNVLVFAKGSPTWMT